MHLHQFSIPKFVKHVSSLPHKNSKQLDSIELSMGDKAEKPRRKERKKKEEKEERNKREL